MPAHYDDGPKTRMESKKSGKKDMGPYSTKHVRMMEVVHAKKVDVPAVAKRGK